MKKKLLIFDMDGTLYLGKELIPGTREMFAYLREKGIEFAFLTNNSSRSLDENFQKMEGFKIPTDREKHYYSSGIILADYMEKRGWKDIYVVGNKWLKDLLRKRFHLVETYDPNTHLDAVAVSFGTEYHYEEIKNACLYLQVNEGIPFVATNGDPTCVVDGGLRIPDCGSTTAIIVSCTGRKPVVVGKPNRESVDIIAERFGVKNSETMVVGDQLDTDIKVGINAGMETVCVLTGEVSQKDVDECLFKPTYTLPSVKELPALLESIEKAD